MTKTLCAFVHEYVEGLAWSFLLSEDSCLKVHLEYFNLWKWVGGDTQRPMLLKDKFMSQFSKRRTPHYTLPLGRSKGARRLGQESGSGVRCRRRGKSQDYIIRASVAHTVQSGTG